MKETVYAYFKAQVEKNPDAVAVFDEKRSLTFGELDALVNTIVAGFDVENPKLIGVVMNHGVEQIASMLAILKSGAGRIVATGTPDEVAHCKESQTGKFL